MYQLGSQEDDQKVTKMSEEPQKRRLHQKQKSKGGNFIFNRDANPPKSEFCTKSNL
jgi:hypothetical protein